MIRIKRLYIKGFKDPDREIELEFPDEPIVIIYGENGSGKTTLLRVIQAILNRDERVIFSENIQTAQVDYVMNGELCFDTLRVDENKVEWFDGEKVELRTVKWEKEGRLTNSTSILSGVNRGVTQESSEFKFFYNELTLLLSIYSPSSTFRLSDITTKRFENYDEKTKYLLERIQLILSRAEQLNTYTDQAFSLTEEKHLSLDFLPVKLIQDAIVKQLIHGQSITSEKVKNAFFNTISNAVEIEMNEESYSLPNNFWSRLREQKGFIIEAIKTLEASNLRDDLITVVDKGDRTEKLKSRIFTALLINILEKAEEKNIPLKAVQRLTEIFNAHLYRNKKLVVTTEEAYIDLGNGRKHGLDALSSGERHFLSFLTLFLIIGNDRNFFLIDEPEISMNLKWQRELLPLLSELNPQAQIIAATHSPAIANRNSKYLVELI